MAFTGYARVTGIMVPLVTGPLSGLANWRSWKRLSKRRYDVHPGNEDWETVNLNTLKNKDAMEIGAEWLCKQAFDQLGIGDLLRQENWDEEKISPAATHIITRTVYPASELKTVSVIKENSAVFSQAKRKVFRPSSWKVISRTETASKIYL
jgi:hypothetical protein